jgi:hypothetical protein
VNYSIRFHQDGHASAIRPEVEIFGSDKSGEMTVHLIWSVADDRDIELAVNDVPSAATSIKLLEAYLRAESMWDDRHSMRGIARLWDQLDVIEAEHQDALELEERRMEHQALTGDGFVL